MTLGKQASSLGTAGAAAYYALVVVGTWSLSSGCHVVCTRCGSELKEEGMRREKESDHP